MKVKVYRNLHKDCWSVQHKGRVIMHALSLCVDDAKLIVNESGRQRVLNEKRKNVHAYIVGTLSNTKHSGTKQVTYNPYKWSSFVEVESGKPITEADRVQFTDNGHVYV